MTTHTKDLLALDLTRLQLAHLPEEVPLTPALPLPLTLALALTPALALTLTLTLSPP